MNRFSKYLCTLTLALNSLQANAENLQDVLNQIGNSVRKNHTGYMVYQGAPFDTVYVLDINGDVIKSSRGFTSLELGVDDGKRLFLYDLGSNGSLDKVAFAKGVISGGQKQSLELEGLSGVDDIDVNLNHLAQKAGGKTPYNTRKVCELSHADSSVKIYDFEGNQSFRASQDFYATLNGLYRDTITKVRTFLEKKK